MEDSTNKLGWMMNLSDQIQTPFANSAIFEDPLCSDCCTDHFPNIIPPMRNVSINRDQFSFFQGTAEQHAGNNSWNCQNHSNPLDLNFGAGTADISLMSYDLKETHEKFGTKRQQGLKNVNKGLVPLHAQDHIIAERKRREKLNQRFVELSSIIPSLKKVLLYFRYNHNSIMTCKNQERLLNSYNPNRSSWKKLLPA
jgi:Helix-loop-helix DNA-binding domain